MGLNVIIYQALLYVFIILVAAIIISYISNKTRKNPVNQNNKFRTPQNHMKSIQKNININNNIHHFNQPNPQTHQYSNSQNQVFNLHTGQVQNQYRELSQQTQIQATPPQYRQAQSGNFYRSSASGSVNANPVYFR